MKTNVIRIMIFVGLIVAGTAATYAQDTYRATTRRVALGKEHMQPVAASAVAVQNQAVLKLNADQQTKLAAISGEATALHQERTTLWKEYYAIKAQPNFNDAIAEKEIAPRMRRIVAINQRLQVIADQQQGQVAAILTTGQQSQLTQMVAATHAAMRPASN